QTESSVFRLPIPSTAESSRRRLAAFDVHVVVIPLTKVKGRKKLFPKLKKLSICRVEFDPRFHDWIARRKMGWINTLLGVLGFAFGLPVGILFGLAVFSCFPPADVEEPVIRPLHELDRESLVEVLSEIPMWVKHPDYERMDWMNRLVYDMWPYLDKAICGMISSILNPLFDEYVRVYYITSIEFRRLSLGTLPPNIQGVKVQETGEKELLFDAVVSWAGNPNVTLVVKFLFLPITIQLLDLQIFAALRITLRPLVPTFPCFAAIAVSLLEKPTVDFGLKLLGADLMAIPGLYQYVQERIRKQVASMYMWPLNLVIPILDESLGAINKPVGILHVKVVRALKLLKKDLLGASDPYVKISLCGEKLTAKRTTIKMKNLNPEWNEDFRMTVKDPKSQVLELHVYDWEKIGKHGNIGVQLVPLNLLAPNKKKEFTLELMKTTNHAYNELRKKKYRGKLVVELTFSLFREDNDNASRQSDDAASTDSKGSRDDYCRVGDNTRGGLLVVTVLGAENVEGHHHNNPYALVAFRGEEKRTKMMKKTRDPKWNEEFQFVLESSPVKEKIYIEVLSKRAGFGFRPKEMLGHAQITLGDVVHNGRINQKYRLINSKNGVISVDIRWKVI
ncbi:SYT3, partial [Linum perenne]